MANRWITALHRSPSWRALKRRAGSSEGFAPRLWPVWLAVPLWLLVAAVAAWMLNAFVRARPSLVGDEPEPIEVTRVVLTLLAAAGAVFAGVYAYRKQRIAEGSSRRADAESFTQRYNSAADQLGHTNEVVRMAGVVALARLADDWHAQRQQCVDLLCGYLRLPFDPQVAPPAERAVRASIVRAITSRLGRFDEPVTSWGSLDYDLAGAYLEDLQLIRRLLTGDNLSFRGATLAGSDTMLYEVDFSGCHNVDFTDATFDSPDTLITIHAPDLIYFDRARFRGSTRIFLNFLWDPSKTDTAQAWFRDATFERSASVTLRSLAGVAKTDFTGCVVEENLTFEAVWNVNVMGVDRMQTRAGASISGQDLVERDREARAP